MPTAHIVLAHPEPGSLNGRLAQGTRETLEAESWTVTSTDLYSEGFDPVEGPRHFPSPADSDPFRVQTAQRSSAEAGALPSDIAAEVDRLLACDLLVLHFPFWWFGMPAILKGWIDRVFVYGLIYRSSMRYDAGRFSGKRMISCATFGASEDACSHNGREGDAALHLWPLLYPFRYVGFSVLQPQTFFGVGSVAYQEGGDGETDGVDLYQSTWRRALQEIDDRAMMLYNPDSDFDDRTRLLPGAPQHSPFIRHEK